MKISELLNKLKSCPPDTDVLCYLEDSENNLLDIVDIYINHAVKD